MGTMTKSILLDLQPSKEIEEELHREEETRRVLCGQNQGRRRWAERRSGPGLISLLLNARSLAAWVRPPKREWVIILNCQ